MLSLLLRPLGFIPVVLGRLLHSRRFWLAVLGVAVSAAPPTIPAPVVSAFQVFALVLISVYTIEDGARGFGKGTD